MLMWYFWMIFWVSMVSHINIPSCYTIRTIPSPCYKIPLSIININATIRYAFFRTWNNTIRRM